MFKVIQILGVNIGDGVYYRGRDRNGRPRAVKHLG